MRQATRDRAGNALPTHRIVALDRRHGTHNAIRMRTAAALRHPIAPLTAQSTRSLTASDCCQAVDIRKPGPPIEGDPRIPAAIPRQGLDPRAHKCAAAKKLRTAAHQCAAAKKLRTAAHQCAAGATSTRLRSGRCNHTNAERALQPHDCAAGATSANTRTHAQRPRKA